MTIIFFTREEVVIDQPLAFLPPVTTAHVTIAGVALFFLMWLVLLFLCRWSPKRGSFRRNYAIPYFDRVTAYVIEIFQADPSNDTLGLRSTLLLSSAGEPVGLEKGDRLGDYVLEDVIGKGTYGVVWRARKGKQLFALKVANFITTVNEQNAEENARLIKQARDEAKRWTTLSHANLVRIVDAMDLGLVRGNPRDSGAAGKFFVIIMPYYERGDLRKYLEKDRSKNKRCTVSLTLEVIFQIGAALDYIHDRKLVHRDVKPSNILMDADNYLLGDFGLARFEYETINSIVAKGTTPYLPPDVQPGDRKASHDVYALGVTMFQMLNGKLPSRRGNSLDFDAAVPDVLRSFLGYALEPNAEDRFGSVREFLAALKFAQKQLEIS
ncbi:MAG: serine/threonine protein kinase [Planctomycetales bacterium]|nr:serine/threonine protein kinase [Planctomycetales bacterium]